MWRAGCVAILWMAALADGPTVSVIGPDLALTRMTVCPDQHTVAAYGPSVGGWTIAWPDPTPRKGPPGPQLEPPCPAASLGFSPDGRLWAVGDSRGGVRLIEAATGHLLRTLDAHVGDVTAVRFSPDGTRLATAGGDNDIVLWETAGWTRERTIDAPTHAEFALAWSPDGRTLYTGGAGETVSAWDASSGTRLRTSPRQPFVITALALSADGRRLAAGAADPASFAHPAAMYLLDAGTLAVTGQVPTRGDVRALAWAPDAHAVLALWGGARGIQVWTVDQEDSGVR